MNKKDELCNTAEFVLKKCTVFKNLSFPENPIIRSLPNTRRKQGIPI